MTIVASFTEDGGSSATGRAVLTSPEMWLAFRNNLIWLVLGTGGSVAIGLARRDPRRSGQARGAGQDLRLPAARDLDGRRGRHLAVRVRLAARGRAADRARQRGLDQGSAERPRCRGPRSSRPLNTFALIVIMIWLQTGFAMVVLSAALKGVPAEVIEAARMDGASERRSSSGSSSR